MKKLFIMACGVLLAVSVSRAADEPAYSAEFKMDGVDYVQNVTDKAVEKTPDWNPEKDAKCPMLMSQAIKLARSEVSKHFFKASAWIVSDITLTKIGDGNKWCYEIGFDSPDENSKDDLQIIVLFNGTVPSVKKGKK